MHELMVIAQWVWCKNKNGLTVWQAHFCIGKGMHPMRCVTCECDVLLACDPITLEHEVSIKPITAFKMLTITAIAMCFTGCAVLQIPNDLFSQHWEFTQCGEQCRAINPCLTREMPDLLKSHKTGGYAGWSIKISDCGDLTCFNSQ